MRINPAVIVCPVLLLLAACAVTPPVSFRQPDGSGSIAGTVNPGTGDTIGANEAMPKNADSLEIPASSGALTVRTTVTDRNSILFHADKQTAGEAVRLPSLIEYFDYDCEFCREHALTDRSWIDREFVATGRMTVERVFVPRTTLGKTLMAAALCAAEQGKFDRMDHALLTLTPRNDGDMQSLRQSLAVKNPAFSLCMKRQTTPSATASGSLRVPTFRLGSSEWQGILTEEELRAKIVDALKNK